MGILVALYVLGHGLRITVSLKELAECECWEEEGEPVPKSPATARWQHSP